MGWKKVYKQLGQDDFEAAEFNLAVGTVYRIDENLREVNFFFKTQDYRKVYDVLKVIFSEIICFLNDTEKKDIEGEEKEIENTMAECYQQTRRGLIFSPTIQMDYALRKWDRDMRGLMMRHKLYMKMGDTRLAAAKPG